MPYLGQGLKQNMETVSTEGISSSLDMLFEVGLTS